MRRERHVFAGELAVPRARSGSLRPRLSRVGQRAWRRRPDGSARSPGIGRRAGRLGGGAGLGIAGLCGSVDPVGGAARWRLAACGALLGRVVGLGLGAEDRRRPVEVALLAAAASAATQRRGARGRGWRCASSEDLLPARDLRRAPAAARFRRSWSGWPPRPAASAPRKRPAVMRGSSACSSASGRSARSHAQRLGPLHRRAGDMVGLAERQVQRRAPASRRGRWRWRSRRRPRRPSPRRWASGRRPCRSSPPAPVPGRRRPRRSATLSSCMSLP